MRTPLNHRPWITVAIGTLTLAACGYADLTYGGTDPAVPLAVATPISDIQTTTNHPVSVVIQVEADNPSAVSLTAQSSDTALIATERLSFAGTGFERTLTLTPEPDVTGEATVTITAQDDREATKTAELAVAVDAPFQTPQRIASRATGLGEGFGVSVSVSGKFAIFGAPLASPGGQSAAGSAFIFERGESGWTQTAALSASDAQGSSWFGRAVDIDGSTAIVGAFEHDVGSDGDAGSAYIFERTEGSWTETARLVASDPQAGGHFGSSVAVSGDFAVVGAHQADFSGAGKAGSAYVFERNGDNWTQTAKLNASDAASDDRFGIAVDISGTDIIVGAYTKDLGTTSEVGSAYLFQFDGTNWVETSKLLASDGQDSDFFGIAVAISADRAIVGASREDASGTNTGSAYIFDRNGGTWTQTAKLNAATVEDDALFGSDVALAGDYAVIGAFGEDAGEVTNAGSAYVFKRSAAGWHQVARPAHRGAAQRDSFGIGVAIDGDLIAIGAPNVPNATETGDVYVFDRLGSP